MAYSADGKEWFDRHLYQGRGGIAVAVIRVVPVAPNGEKRWERAEYRWRFVGFWSPFRTRKGCRSAGAALARAAAQLGRHPGEMGWRLLSPVEAAKWSDEEAAQAYERADNILRIRYGSENERKGKNGNATT